MYKHNFLLIALLFLLLANSCSTVYQAYSEEEPGVNIYKYLTYNWLERTQIEEDKVSLLLSDTTERKIRSSVEAELAHYGFRQCDVEPDLMLHYHAIVKNKEIYYLDWTCDDEEWHKYGRCQRIRETNFREGTLIIDFIDARNSNQVWRGVAIGAVDNMSRETVDKQIEEAVRRIFKKFPEKPRPGMAGK